MNLTIPISALVAARKLLTRLRFERFTLPIIKHILVTIDKAGLSLAVTDLDHWLETRVSATIDPFTPARFLMPSEALKAAARGDKKSNVHLSYATTDDGVSLTLTATCGGMSVKTVYHLEPTVEEFPARPVVHGQIAVVPKATFAALGIVAGSASTDATRYVLNGVHFTPDDGGMLIATDGRRLAGAPARVPAQGFILPNSAVHVLAHPDFTTRDAAILQAKQSKEKDGEDHHIQFRSGPHTLIAREIEGSYPNHRNVIPSYLPQSATIAETHRNAVIAWLRSLTGKSNTVRLTWETPGHLTLTHRDFLTVGATLQVPVTVDGSPPAISFDPKYLADALAIGSTLRLVDNLNPGMATDPTGNFCVVMNKRCDIETTAENSTIENAASQTPAPAVAAVAA